MEEKIDSSIILMKLLLLLKVDKDLIMTLILGLKQQNNLDKAISLLIRLYDENKLSGKVAVEKIVELL